MNVGEGVGLGKKLELRKRNSRLSDWWTVLFVFVPLARVITLVFKTIRFPFTWLCD